MQNIETLEQLEILKKSEEQIYSKWIESTVQVNNFENLDPDTTIHHLEYLFTNQL